MATQDQNQLTSRAFEPFTEVSRRSDQALWQKAVEGKTPKCLVFYPKIW